MTTAKKVANNLSSKDGVRLNGTDAIERMRAWLIDNDYAQSATRALTRGTPADEAAAKSASDLPVVRLLLHGSSLTAAEAKALFAPQDLQEWIDAGLLVKAKKCVLPLVRITPYGKLFVVSDREWIEEVCARPDVVMGLTGSSTWLADFTIRRESECTLDLGTGTGVLAMLAARHSKQVVATDINPRALEFARFNAALNGIDNIDFIEGDMFDAVEGRTFDLILNNPPLDGDEFVERIVQQAPAYLNDCGYAQIVCHWVQSNNESWTKRLSDWLKPTGCDAWIVRGKSSNPADYARKWLDGYDTANVEELFGDWMSYYKKQGIASIDSGLITMRRSRRRPNWIRIDTELPRIFPDAGTHVARCFWLQDFLARAPGHELLNEILYLSPSVELTQKSRPTITGWKQVSCEFAMTRGIAFATKLDPEIARVVASCNGRLQLGQLLQAVAMADEEEFDVIVTRYLGAIRQLVMLGFLWPLFHGLGEEESMGADSKSSQIMLEAEQHAAEILTAAAQAQGCDEKEAHSA